MSEPPIMTIKNAQLSFAALELFSNVELFINKGDKISLVGRNGSGKSTLLKVIAGIIEPDSGEKFIQPGVKIAYMPQEPDISEYKTLRDVVLSGLDYSDNNADYLADILIEQFNILPNQESCTASGGEQRKAFLAKTLISQPDILLLDEPTNHLDMPTIQKLENIITEFQGAVIVISHDRRFLANISDTTFWLDRGILRRNNKGFRFFEEWQEQVINQEIIEQKYLNKKIEAETEWLHKGVTARRKRNMGRLRRLQQLREERKNQIKQIGSVNIEIDEGTAKSKLVIEAKNISKSFVERPIVKDFSIKIMRENKIGIVGPNGAGKSTLIKLLTKRLEPDSGFVRIGKNLEEAYFDQNRISLDPKKTLWKTLCNEGDHVYVRGQYRHVVAYLKDFLFKPEQAQCPVSALSGGEKNRLMLAVALARPSNLLVLDEPTNDLDMDTMDLLQEVLSEYEGTALIVSHDRDFLDRVVTSILYMPGDGSLMEYPGSYSELEQFLQKKSFNSIKTPVKEKTKINKSEPPKKATKLSYNQKRLLETLPLEIQQLENDISLLEEQLNQADFYLNNPQKFNEITSSLISKKQELDNMENQWLEIQILQDSLVQNS